MMSITLPRKNAEYIVSILDAVFDAQGVEDIESVEIHQNSDITLHKVPTEMMVCTRPR